MTSQEPSLVLYSKAKQPKKKTKKQKIEEIDNPLLLPSTNLPSFNGITAATLSLKHSRSLDAFILVTLGSKKLSNYVNKHGQNCDSLKIVFKDANDQNILFNNFGVIDATKGIFTSQNSKLHEHFKKKFTYRISFFDVLPITAEDLKYGSKSYEKYKIKFILEENQSDPNNPLMTKIDTMSSAMKIFLAPYIPWVKNIASIPNVCLPLINNPKTPRRKFPKNTPDVTINVVGMVLDHSPVKCGFNEKTKYAWSRSTVQIIDDSDVSINYTMWKDENNFIDGDVQKGQKRYQPGHMICITNTLVTCEAKEWSLSDGNILTYDLLIDDEDDPTSQQEKDVDDQSFKKFNPRVKEIQDWILREQKSNSLNNNNNNNQQQHNVYSQVSHEHNQSHQSSSSSNGNVCPLSIPILLEAVSSEKHKQDNNIREGKCYSILVDLVDILPCVFHDKVQNIFYPACTRKDIHGNDHLPKVVWNNLTKKWDCTKDNCLSSNDECIYKSNVNIKTADFTGTLHMTCFELEQVLKCATNESMTLTKFLKEVRYMVNGTNRDSPLCYDDHITFNDQLIVCLKELILFKHHQFNIVIKLEKSGKFIFQWIGSPNYFREIVRLNTLMEG